MILYRYVDLLFLTYTIRCDGSYAATANITLHVKTRRGGKGEALLAVYFIKRDIP